MHRIDTISFATSPEAGTFFYPWTLEIERVYQRGMRTTQIQPGYEFLDNTDGMLVEAGGMTFGPHIGELANHTNRLAVIRGMSMDTLTHEVGMRRFLTGKAPAGLQARGSSAATWLASHYGGYEPIPNLAVQVESYNEERPNYATGLAVNSVSDLIRALRPAEPSLPLRISQQISNRMRDAALCPRGQRSDLWLSAEASRQKAQEMVMGGLAERFDFRLNTPEMEDIRGFYGFNRNQTNTPEVRGAMAVQAITSGISRCVSLSVCGGLDTHFDEWEDGVEIRARLSVVSRILKDLAKALRGYR